MGLRQKSEAKPSINPSQRLVARLLEEEPQDKTSILEASVHTGRRCRVFVATFTGPHGGQVWKTTGLTDYHQALQLARKWEAQAAAQRAKLGRTPTKPGKRTGAGGLTQKEVARILKMSERGVRAAERRAFQKLRNHPRLRQLWSRYLAGELDEDYRLLSSAEIVALFDVAETPEQLRLIEKVLAMIQC
jgi:hypothetical protein